MSCHVLLQGVFPTQGLNLSLLCLPALAGGFFTTEPAVKPLPSLANKNAACPVLPGNSFRHGRLETPLPSALGLCKPLSL